jgi:hypothetical protein
MIWYVYIARDGDQLIDGVCNDLIVEETLLNYESDWTTNYKIIWFLESKNKIEALGKLRNLSSLSDTEKLKLISESQKIIIMSEDFDIDNQKYPLVCNLKYTLSLINFLNALPELWKLNDLYVENVAEYLAIKKNQVEYVKLWDISIDVSKNVGLITKEKFFPIIRC